MTKTPQRPTVTLLFAVLAATLGTWYAAGYSAVVLNVPQSFVVSWIRQVECGRSGSMKNHSETENSSIHDTLWCGELTEEDKMFLLRDNAKLNSIWAVVNSIVAAGILMSTFTCTFFISRLGLKGTIYVASGASMTGSVLSALVHAVQAYELMIVGRLLCGFSEGLTGVAVVMYVEIAVEYTALLFLTFLNDQPSSTEYFAINFDGEEESKYSESIMFTKCKCQLWFLMTKIKKISANFNQRAF